MQKINSALRIIFFIVIKFIVIIYIGLNVRKKELLPEQGPAIIAANHNSHLDALVLISQYPLTKINKVRPVAAADYFCRNRLFRWFTSNIIGIIPIVRGKASKNFDPLQLCYEALDNDQIIILFPEGSRGEPEQMTNLKKGIAFLTEKYPQIPVTPVFIHGLGKCLPKGDNILVPFFCDVFVGNQLKFNVSRSYFMSELYNVFYTLSKDRELL